MRRALVPMLLATVGCPSTGAPDGGHRDARSSTTTEDAGPTLAASGALRVRLANLLPAGPSLTVCLSTRPGTGVPETEGHLLGTADPARGLDGSLPYPGVSPTLTLPVYPTPGFGYVVRLFDRARVPFVSGGRCPTDGSVSPIVTASLTASAITTPVLLAAIGVLPGSPTACPGATCPSPRLEVFADDLTTPPSGRARARIVHAIPNLPVAVHVCFDADFTAGDPGPVASRRVLPEASDTNGLAFGEASAFVEVPPVASSPGAFFVHANVPGAPDCFAATALLGPIVLPFPVPSTAPAEVARTIDAGDVISLFAYGRAGMACTTDTECASIPGGVCRQSTCVDALSPGVLPWLDLDGPTR